MDRGHARHFGDVEYVIRELVDEFEPDAVPLCEAPRLWKTLDQVERLAASAKTLLARRVEDSAEWKRNGFKSAAEQLAADAGTSVTSAQILLDTSKRVAKQPKTEAALRAGELSSRKAEMVAKAVEIAPDAADELLAWAKTAPLGRLKQEAVRAKTAVDGDARHDRIHKERSAREYTDDEGVWHFHAKGTIADGQRFRAALEPIVDRTFKDAYKQGRREPRDAYAFDAFIALAEHSPGEQSTSRKYLGLVRVDLEAMLRGYVEGDEVCEISGLGPIPVRVAQDLLGDAVLKLVITRGIDVANVTHLGRACTAAQKAALWWRSPICDVIECNRTQRLEIDHETGWAETHTTRVDDSNCFCSHHHWLKTVHGWALIDGTGRRKMVPPDGPHHPKNKPKE
jgi:hypothetical protein